MFIRIDRGDGSPQFVIDESDVSSVVLETPSLLDPMLVIQMKTGRKFELNYNRLPVQATYQYFLHRAKDVVKAEHYALQLKEAAAMRNGELV